MLLRAPAKLNLHLKVAPPTPDGYHPLLSWFTTLSLHDEITLTPPTGFTFSMTCSDPDLPTDDRNLLHRAANRIALSAHAHLLKRIPQAAGLGGGSSDAAALLRAAQPALDPGLPQSIAPQLGSDVPFFLANLPSALCTGRGQHVHPLPRPKPQYALLFLPNLHLPTPAVYQRFDQMYGFTHPPSPAQHPARPHPLQRVGPTPLAEPDFPSWSTLPAQDLMEKLQNDLEPPAFSLAPSLATLRANLEQTINQPVRMTGSGSTLFTLADTQDHAHALAHRLPKPSPARIEICQLAPDPEPSPAPILFAEH